MWLLSFAAAVCVAALFMLAWYAVFYRVKPVSYHWRMVERDAPRTCRLDGLLK
jgi:hypothetical protein